jgi:hypothetical protein
MAREITINGAEGPPADGPSVGRRSLGRSSLVS